MDFAAVRANDWRSREVIGRAIRCSHIAVLCRPAISSAWRRTSDVKSSNRSAVGRHRRHAVLGVARIRSINIRKADGWQTITENFIAQPIDLAA